MSSVGLERGGLFLPFLSQAAGSSAAGGGWGLKTGFQTICTGAMKASGYAVTS